MLNPGIRFANRFPPPSTILTCAPDRSLVEQFSYLKQLIFKTLWNRLFQKEEDELAWLLDPHRAGNHRFEATVMTSFNKNIEESVVLYNRRRDVEPKKSFGESALEVARYMGMGVYMTSTSFPSPFLPVNDACLFDEAIFDPRGLYREY